MGAALSNAVAGFIVDEAGFNTAFLCLAVIASDAFVLFCLFVPETRDYALGGALATRKQATALRVAE